MAEGGGGAGWVGGCCEWEMSPPMLSHCRTGQQPLAMVQMGQLYLWDLPEKKYGRRSKFVREPGLLEVGEEALTAVDLP